MMKRTGKIELLILIIILLNLNSVFAEITQSDTGVYYDDNILEEFENTNNLEVVVFLKDDNDLNNFLLDYSNIDDFSGNKLDMEINLDVFNSLINDERVSMVLHENAFSEENIGAEAEYDVEILGLFLINDWVPVMVDVKDISNIIITKEDLDSGNFDAKVNKRNRIMIDLTDSVLSTLSKEEFQLKRSSEFGGFFSGDITKEGFDKLLKDERVKKIHDNTVKGHISSAVMTKGILKYIIIVIFLLIVSLIILLFKLKKRKWKIKKQTF